MMQTPVEQQKNALELASESGKLDIVRILVEHGADTNARGMYLGNSSYSKNPLV